MGIREGLTAGMMGIDAEGRPVVYPWGVFGAGYVLPSKAEYHRLQRLVAAWIAAVAVGVYGVGTLFGSVAMLAYASGLTGGAAAFLARKLRGLPRVPRPAPRSHFRRMATSSHPLLLWGMVLFCAGLAMLAFEMGRTGRASAGPVAAVALFAGAGLAQFGWMLLLRRRDR